MWCDGDGNCSSNDDWHSWGQYLVICLVLVLIVIAIIIFTYINSRRRRHAGLRPYYGTGWLGRKYSNEEAPVAGQDYNPPPVYSPPANQQDYMGNSEGYGTSHQTYEMQPPLQSFQPGAAKDHVHNPPNDPSADHRKA